ncbi:response regulator [Salibacteraceae bacterium]|nr:response regulator [Salibacteraceae bacterium]
MWDECAIVDDNKFDRLICRRIVEKMREAGKLVEFDSSNQLLSYLSSQKTEKKGLLIFLDINMPGMNGLDLLKKLNEDEEFKDLVERLSIFIMTSSTLTQEIESARNYSFVDGIIPKPMSIKKVTDIMLNAY